jgi:anhydro-N-acetylmuramic acid kinase
MKRLLEIYKKRTRVVVGLMSGTSHDGVDAAVARIDGSGARSKVSLLHHSHHPYPDTLRGKVAHAFDGPTELICGLNFELGEFFAGAALSAIKGSGLAQADIDLIGSHGQTIYHAPPRPAKAGSTLQIGEGAVIAARTGIVTISDFRTADVAHGGHGAPLVPMANWILFHSTGKVFALQNIGGIANVTVVPDEFEGVTGFDTGPGNSLLDEAARVLSGGRLKYDKAGMLAKSGKVIPDLLDSLLRNPYFKKKPPKSTGRELFGRELAGDIIKTSRYKKKEDIICTLTHLTARSIHKAYADFVFPRYEVDKIILSGGGARNDFLVSLLSRLFDGTPVVKMDELGIPGQAVEALSFAVLANETASGNPGNVPAVTGAANGAVLGKISL